MKTLEQMGIAAKSAAAVLASASSETKNKLLNLAADMLVKNEEELIKENEKDIDDIPEQVRSELTIVLASHIDTVLDNSICK